DALVLQVVLADGDLDLQGLLTGDGHAADALDVAEFRDRDVLQIGGQFVHVAGAADGEHDDREVGQTAGHDGRFDAVRQGGLDLGDGALQRADDLVGVRAVVRLHDDLGGPGGRGGLDA